MSHALVEGRGEGAHFQTSPITLFSVACCFQGAVQVYGTHAELSEQNFDTTQLLGLIRKKKVRDEFSYKDEEEDSEEEEDG